MPGTITDGDNERQDRNDERFARMQAQMEEMQGKLAQYQEAISERDETIASQGAEVQRLRQEQLQTRFSAEAEQFTALGVKSDELAPELLWLFAVDDSADKPHYAFFSGLLRQVDAALHSGAFRERGASSPSPQSAAASADARVRKLAGERNLDLEKGETYANLLKEVLDAEPELYTAYRKEQLARG